MKYLFVIGLLVLAACSALVPTEPTTQQEILADVDKKVDLEQNTLNLAKAPSFSLQTSNGKPLSLQKSIDEGKPTVIYFMASWCTSCAKNWEALNEVYPKYQDKVNFVAVSVDPTDSATVLQELAMERGFVFDTSPGNPALAISYDVKKQTAKFVIDKQGNIVSRHDGILSADEWTALFESVI